MARVLAHLFDAGHPILVLEDQGMRHLQFRSGIAQSSMDLRCPEQLCLAYTRAMMLSLALTPVTERVLALGLGGGSIPRFLLHHFPAVQVDAVELSSQVIAMACRHFFVSRGRRLTLHEGDASVFVRHAVGRGLYNIIFVDLFEPEAMARPLYDPSFHAACLKLLDPQGVLCVNLWSGDSRRHRLALNALASGCGQAPLLLPVAHRGNVIAFALAAPQARSQVLARARSLSGPLEERLSLPFFSYLEEMGSFFSFGDLLRRFFHRLLG